MRALLLRGVVGIVLIVPVVWAIGINNRLVVLEQDVAEKAAAIQNEYQRRANLIPSLVETVKGFATQEKGVLEGVTRARASATAIQLTPDAVNDPRAMGNFLAAQDQLSGALNRLMVTVERYPTLTSNRNFMALQREITKTENGIAGDRKSTRLNSSHIQKSRMPSSA